jgi:phosphatidate cytidylyltransferase
MPSDLAKRLTVAAIGIPLCIIVTLLGGWPFALGLGILAATGTWELARMLRQRGRNFLTILGGLFAAALPLTVLELGWMAAWALTIISVLTIAGFATLRFPPAERPFQTGALTVAGALYIGGLLSFGVPLREWLADDPIQGTVLFFLPVAVTWLADTAAFFGGRTFGRRKLAPAISPNKTVEGGMAGLLAGPVGTVAYGSALLPDIGARVGIVGLAILGLMISAGAVMGDLVESGLKRECGVKDSSNLLPGHGGLLDRMDSLLWSIPIAYFFLSAVL